MPDLLAQYKDALIAAMERSVGAMLAERGVPLFPATGFKGEALGANGVESVFMTFATGYDGTNTTMGFMLDNSPLDGTDKLL